MKYIPASVLTIALCALPNFVVRGQEPSTETPGLDIVNVEQMTATVTKVDLENRKVTLQLEDGREKTVKVRDEVQNLDQVHVGDKLVVKYATEVLLNVGNEPPASPTGQSVIAVAPKGEKPAMIMVNTATATVKIVDVDPENHRVTVEGADGKQRTLHVSKKVESLDKLKVGDTVTATMTEGLAMSIAK